MFVIHYHERTGKISAWGDLELVPYLAEHCAVAFENEFPVDPARHKIDIDTRAFVDKSPSEMAPTRDEVNGAVALELAATDQFMVSDRPLTDTERLAWLDYRHALRGLSRLCDGGADMLHLWPMRPDGLPGAAAPLRARLPKED